MSLRRRINYKMYPNAGQKLALDQVVDSHRELYNAALEERIDAYRKHKISISFADQCKSLTLIRAFDKKYAGINAQSLQVTLKRLDLAFQSFFRRARQNQAPGFPRFRSKGRFDGFGFKSHGDGFKFFPGPDWVNGSVRISGVGMIGVRGRARIQGRVVCADVMKKSGYWYLSVVIECNPFRKGGDAICGLDWGVETMLVLAYDENTFDSYENDRLYQCAEEKITTKRRQLARCKRRSKTREKQKAELGRLTRKLANRRKDRSHKISAQLVADHAIICTEDLSISSMTRAGKTNQVRKAGLNREVLDTAPALLFTQLRYKAEEAGIELVFIDTRKHKPSQTCPSCGVVKKKSLGQRTHQCDDCGFVASRDQAAALVMLQVGLLELGVGTPPTGLISPETSFTKTK
jgi:putative transposase